MDGTLYASWKDIPSWPHRFFTAKELACPATGSILYVPEAVARLDAVREILGVPMTINSAYRDPIHNAKIGGAPLSHHKDGHAFDVSLRGFTREALIGVAKACGFTGFGFYDTFQHIDCGRPRVWDYRTKK